MVPHLIVKKSASISGPCYTAGQGVPLAADPFIFSVVPGLL